MNREDDQPMDLDNTLFSDKPIFSHEKVGDFRENSIVESSCSGIAGLEVIQYMK